MRKIMFLAAAVLIVAPILIVAFVNRPATAPKFSTSSNGAGLKVINGGQFYTDVPAGQLQPANPPENSAANKEQNPQQAIPNYCVTGEEPYIDGCVSR